MRARNTQLPRVLPRSRHTTGGGKQPASPALAVVAAQAPACLWHLPGHGLTLESTSSALLQNKQFFLLPDGALWHTRPDATQTHLRAEFGSESFHMGVFIVSWRRQRLGGFDMLQ